ncbi:MAG: phosphatidylserine decarboxylase [Bacteroidota bacterium]
MSFKHSIYRFLSLNVWGSLPAWLQKGISWFYTRIYEKPFSKHFIRPYCKIHYPDPNYLDQFKPPKNKSDFQNFQDFFIREFKKPPEINSEAVWGCEGILCEYGKVDETPLVKVKGEERHLKTIFGRLGDEIPSDYFFSNVFLHNRNYHRIHTPVTGIIKRIERIAGDLVLLRPWVYKKDPSLPALRNERVNVDVEDDKGRRWFLSIVGGPAVGTIVMGNGIEIGSEVSIGQEIGTFLLGSTLCIAAPVELSKHTVGDQVFMGEPF